jgi:NAD(P)-dependent dehydrogenase (short-subunit alcohol dehydrogenase family)
MLSIAIVLLCRRPDHLILAVVYSISNEFLIGVSSGGVDPTLRRAGLRRSSSVGRNWLVRAGRAVDVLEPELDGRVALVTGSARGVGRALALGLAAAGADVAIHYHTSAEAAASAAAEAREQGVAATTVQGDVTEPGDVDDLVGAVEATLGGVDVLVNNVGDFAPVHWETLSFDDWRRVTETNYYGTYLCSKRVLPGMREREWGRIVNVGYAGTDRALVYPKNFPYFVAKTGVLMFTRMLANDTTDDGITVNAVSPYVVENSDEFPPEAPRGRWASFEDLLQVVYFFVDEDSDYVSGENVEVDGGWIPEAL